MIKNIADELLNRFGSWCLRITSGLLNVIISFFDLNDFRPTFTYFNEQIINGEDNLNNIFSCFQYVGFVILIILFAWNVAAMVINRTYKDKDVKDNLRTLFIRSVLCIMLISASQFLCRDVLAPTVDGFYEHVIIPLVGQGVEGDSGVLKIDDSDNKESMMDSIKTSNYDDYQSVALTQDENGEWIVHDKLGNELSQEEVAEMREKADEEQKSKAGGNIIGFVACFVEAWFLGSILINYLKLIIELVRRYAKLCFMYITFPLVGATYVSTASENIFLNYLGGFINESICIVVTVFIIRLTTWFMQVCTGNFLSVFFICGWINIGISLEQFMREHGFVIGSSGGSLLDNMLQTAHNMSSFGRNAAGKASKAVGRGMIGAAAISNCVPLAKAGTLMAGMGMGDAAAMAAMRQSLGGAIGRTINGGSENLGWGQMDAMDRMFRRSGDLAEKGAFLSSYNMLNSDDQERYANHLLNDVVGMDNIKNAMGLSDNANLEFSDVSMDQKGNIVGKATTDMGTTDFSIGTDALKDGVDFTSNNKDAMHMAFSNGAIDDMNDGVSLDKLVSEDALESNNIAGNPLSTMGGFTANDINKLTAAYDDNDLSNYIFRNENGISRIDYANDKTNELGNYNGIMKSEDSQTFNSARMCADFNGTHQLLNSSSDEHDIRNSKHLNVGGNAPSEFSSFGISQIRSVEYKNGHNSTNGWVLSCHMKNGEIKMYDYIPASEHPRQVRKGATIIRGGGILAEHKQKRMDEDSE